MPSTFTVVVPLYNKGAEIGRCVSSVLAQTFSNFELVIVDDGSTDKSAEVVRGFDDDRVRLVQQINAGVAAARNRGIAEASSEWIAFLDADDTWLPGHLHNLNDLRIHNPHARFLSTGYWTDKGNNALRRVAVSPLVPVPTSFLKMADGLLVPSCTAMTKAALKEVGGYREIIGEDVDVWFRVGALYPMAYSRRATAVWHLDAGNRRTHRNEHVARTEKYAPGGLLPSLQFIESHTANAQAALDARHYLAQRELKMIRRALGSGDRDHALALYAWWCRIFAGRDRLTEWRLATPCWIHRASAGVRKVVRSGRALLGYGLHHLGLVKPHYVRERPVEA